MWVELHAHGKEGATGDPITYAADGAVGLVRMDDGKANAIQRELCEALQNALDRAEREPVAVVVLCGRPGFFSAGLDLKVLPGLDAEDLRATTALFVETMRRVFLFPKPVVAASEGHAIAGGMMLYLAADVRLAVDEDVSRYGLNEALTGIPLVAGTAGICQYGIPPQHHTEMILHGRLLTARETCERGVTEELVPAREFLLERALARANGLVSVEPNAYRVNKLMLRRAAFDVAARIAQDFAAEVPSGNVFSGHKR